MRLFIQLGRVALKSVAANKLRSTLTMLGIIIGVSAVIAMVGIGQGAKARVQSRIMSLGTNLLIVRPGYNRRGHVRRSRVSTLTRKDALAIRRQVSDVALVSPEAGRTLQVKHLARNTSTTVLGATPAYLGVNNFRIGDGEFFSERDLKRRSKVAVLGATTAAALFSDASPVGRKVKINGINFRVVGVLEAKGQQGYRDPDDQIVVPLTTAGHRLFGQTHLRAINVQVATESSMRRAEGDIGELLRRRHRIPEGADPDFHIRNQKEILSAMSAVTDTFTTLLAAVAAVSMLVGGIGIMNIMLVSVTERTREIGIRKAVGARPRDILTQFLVESLMLSLRGGAAGVLVGLGVSWTLGATGSWETSVGAQSVLLAFGIAAATGVFFGLYPARAASRLAPVDALRHE